MPEGWSVWKPAVGAGGCSVRGVEGGLLVESGGDPYAVGGVTQEIRGHSGRAGVSHLGSL